MRVKKNKVILICTCLNISVIIIGVLVLFGWLFNVPTLKSILPGYISMNPLTAVNLILIAGGILLHNKEPNSPLVTLRIIASLVTGVIILKLANLFFLTGFKPDKLLFSQSLGDNQMAGPTAFNFIFLGSALFFSSIKRKLAVTLSQLLALLCLSLSSLYLCAYLFHLNSIIGVIKSTPMALHTAIAFILLSIALLLAKRDGGFMRTFMSASLGGMITRKAFPIFILIPFVVGYLRILGQKKGLYNTEFGAAILVVTTGVLCGIAMWYYARVLNTIHVEWKHTEASLRLSESKFSSAFNFSGIGIALVSLTGAWLDVNEALSKLLGYTKDEMMALTFQDITHPEDLNRDIDYINKLIEGKINTYQIEERYLHKDGRTIWIALTSSLVYDENDLPKFFVSQIVDISLNKRLFAELATKNKVLSFTTKDLESKMGQLEEFNKIVAHNLRGPAGSIEKLAEMAIEADSEEERLEMLEMVRQSSESLNETLSELMAVLEVRLNKNILFEECDILKIIQKIEQMLKGEIISKKAQIVTALEIPLVQYPKVYLESIFYNMISNALKYSKQNEPPIIHICSKVVDDKVKLTFEDNGLGIDLVRHGSEMFKLSKVFHTGYNSKGVGLFMTKNQIETFGGTIGVKSEPGHGTEFAITL